MPIREEHPLRLFPTATAVDNFSVSLVVYIGAGSPAKFGFCERIVEVTDLLGCLQDRCFDLDAVQKLDIHRQLHAPAQFSGKAAVTKMVCFGVILPEIHSCRKLYTSSSRHTRIGNVLGYDSYMRAKREAEENLALQFQFAGGNRSLGCVLNFRATEQAGGDLVTQNRLGLKTKFQRNGKLQYNRRGQPNVDTRNRREANIAQRALPCGHLPGNCSRNLKGIRNREFQAGIVQGQIILQLEAQGKADTALELDIVALSTGDGLVDIIGNFYTS